MSTLSKGNTPTTIISSINVAYALLLASIIFLLYYVAWAVGITPANQDELEFIDTIKASVFMQDHGIRTAIEETDQSAYVSRLDFLKVKAAFDKATPPWIDDYYGDIQ